MAGGVEAVEAESGVEGGQDALWQCAAGGGHEVDLDGVDGGLALAHADDLEALDVVVDGQQGVLRGGGDEVPDGLVGDVDGAEGVALGGHAGLLGVAAELAAAGELAACLGCQGLGGVQVGLRRGDVDADEGHGLGGGLHLIHMLELVVGGLLLLVAHGILLGVEVAVRLECVVGLDLGVEVLGEHLPVDVVGLEGSGQGALVELAGHAFLGAALGAYPGLAEGLHVLGGLAVLLGVEDGVPRLLGCLHGHSGLVELLHDELHLGNLGVEHINAEQVAAHADAHLAYGLVEQGLGDHLLEHHLLQGLAVGRVGVVAQLLVGLRHAALVLHEVDFVAADLGHGGAVAENLAAVGERVTDDERKKGHCYDDKQQYGPLPDFLECCHLFQ